MPGMALRWKDVSIRRFLLVACYVHWATAGQPLRALKANPAPTQPAAALVQRTGGVFDSIYSVFFNGAKIWLPDVYAKHIVDRAHPVAPEDRLMPGVEMQHEYSDAGPPPRTRDGVIVYYSPWGDQPGNFPQQVSSQVPFQMQPPLLRGNRLECSDTPQDWVDATGFTCGMYQQRQWCTPYGTEGLRWDKAKWGALVDWKNALGQTAIHSCCTCGGGKTEVFAGRILTPLDKRRLLAPEDKLPVDPPLEAPLDGGSKFAAEDTIPLGFRRFLYETELESLRKDPAGLSVRYYGAPPTDCSKSGGVLPKARVSAIDKFVKYELGGVGRDLRWPAQHINTVGGFFWGRWSGTVQILKAGLYTFDLDVGFNTESIFNVDGTQLKTPGQCRVAPDEGACTGKGCTWNNDTGACANGAVATPAQAYMAAGGHCLEAIVMVTPSGHSLELQYAGPDTSGTKIVVPSQVLYCDPVVLACTRPELDACGSVRAAYAMNSKCGGTTDAANDVPPELTSSGVPVPVPAPAPVKPAALPLILNFKLQNIDFNVVQSDPPVMQGMASKIRVALVSIVDNAVAPEDITIELASGSVLVRATVHPPPTADSQALMESYENTREVSKAVIEEVETVDGIDEATAGAIGLTRLEVKFGEPPTTTTTAPPATVASPAPGPAPGPVAAAAQVPAPAVQGVAMVVAVAPDEASTEAMENT